MTTTTKELIEKLSDYMHNVWSNWYLYQRKFTNEENEIRWLNQSMTKYINLSKEDKEKDRKFAREILKILEKHLQEPTEETEVECVIGDNCPNCNSYGDFFPTQKYCSNCGAKIKRID